MCSQQGIIQQWSAVHHEENILNNSVHGEYPERLHWYREVCLNQNVL